MSTWKTRLADYLMKHDKRPPLEQIKSGFRIIGKHAGELRELARTSRNG
jgi:hypothetical protein